MSLSHTDLSHTIGLSVIAVMTFYYPNVYPNVNKRLYNSTPDYAVFY